MFQNVHITYSDHAQARMGDRAIFKKQVRRTLRRPDRRYAQGREQIAEYATSKGVIIRVVYRLLPPTLEGSGGGAVHVVTVVRLGSLRGAAQTAPIETVYDERLDVAYVGLLSGRIAKTTEVGGGVYFDLADDGEVVGAEILNYSRYQLGENDSASLFERLPFFLP
jgi:uncharacterized protein YuzE